MCCIYNCRIRTDKSGCSVSKQVLTECEADKVRANEALRACELNAKELASKLAETNLAVKAAGEGSNRAYEDKIQVLEGRVKELETQVRF